MTLVTLAAFVLRVWQLASLGDLDFDEQASYFIASMPPGEMLAYLRAAPFEHPPVFYLLFHSWLTLVGGSEPAMRTFSVIVGTALVLLVGCTVYRSLGTGPALAAAAFVAVSPLYLFYSRDARMYPLLALWIAGVVWALGSAEALRPSRLLVGVVFGAVAVATHYYAVLPVGGALIAVMTFWQPHRGLTGALTPPQRPSRDRLALVLLAILAVAAFAGAFVWVRSASGLLESLSIVHPRQVPVEEVLRRVVDSLSAPLAGPNPTSITAGVGACIAIATLCLALRHGISREPLGRIALSAWLCTAIGIPLLALLGGPFASRYVVCAAPAAAVLVAYAARGLPRGMLGILALVYVVAAIAVAWPWYGSYARSDYGHAMATLRERVRPDDAIVLNGPWQYLLYQRYGWGLPQGQVLTSRVPTVREEATARLAELTGTHPRLWVVDSATDLTDPEGIVARWLDEHAYPDPVVSFDKALLRPYLSSAPAPLDAHQVDGAPLGLPLVSVALERWLANSGDELRLELHTQHPSSAAQFRLLARLVDPQGATLWHWDGSLTSTMGGLTYRAGITVPATAAPGRYLLEAVVYESGSSADGSHTVQAIADPVALGTITVVPTSNMVAPGQTSVMMGRIIG